MPKGLFPGPRVPARRMSQGPALPSSDQSPHTPSPGLQGEGSPATYKPQNLTPWGRTFGASHPSPKPPRSPDPQPQPQEGWTAWPRAPSMAPLCRAARRDRGGRAGTEPTPGRRPTPLSAEWARGPRDPWPSSPARAGATSREEEGGRRPYPVCPVCWGGATRLPTAAESGRGSSRAQPRVGGTTAAGQTPGATASPPPASNFPRNLAAPRRDADEAQASAPAWPRPAPRAPGGGPGAWARPPRPRGAASRGPRPGSAASRPSPRARVPACPRAPGTRSRRSARGNEGYPRAQRPGRVKVIAPRRLPANSPRRPGRSAPSTRPAPATGTRRPKPPPAPGCLPLPRPPAARHLGFRTPKRPSARSRGGTSEHLRGSSGPKELLLRRAVWPPPRPSPARSLGVQIGLGSASGVQSPALGRGPRPYPRSAGRCTSSGSVQGRRAGPVWVSVIYAISGARGRDQLQFPVWRAEIWGGRCPHLSRLGQSWEKRNPGRGRASPRARTCPHAPPTHLSSSPLKIEEGQVRSRLGGRASQHPGGAQGPQ